MSGLRKICKAYGAVVINGQRMVWDYVADEPVPESEMPPGSERHKKSEVARWLDVAGDQIERSEPRASD